MTVPDFRTNYTRALRLAATGDRRQLVEMLKSGVPLHRADMTMLAALLQGQFRPRKAGGRPEQTAIGLFFSDRPMHRAVVAMWLERAYGTAQAKAVADRFDVDPESLNRTFRRLRARFANPPAGQQGG